MNRKLPPAGLCAAVLALALLWRVTGAAVSAEEWRHLKTECWQARTLMMGRALRMGRLWIGQRSQPEQAEDNLLGVYVTEEERLVRMPLEEYVAGVVAGEMQASSHLEALKAQAVAARTRALWQREAGGCALHPGADICTDSAHCQGFATQAERQTLWGDSYASYEGRVEAAGSSTKGEVITYEGKPITVLYHAISGGRTEDAQTVFSQSLPYLQSVESAGEENVQGYWQETEITFDEMARRLNEAFPDMALTAETVRRTLSIAGYTNSGRVQSMQVGGRVVDATDFRSALGLRSTWFSIASNETGVTFQQRGYGHGVGMSQAGANAMAANGADYAAILCHYYQGTKLETR